MDKNKHRNWIKIIIIIPILILLCSRIDSLIFGGNWRMYLIGCILETSCFLSGIILGRLTYTN